MSECGCHLRDYEDIVNEIYRGLMQWLASKAHNLEVPGSSPGPATKNGEKILGEYHLIKFKSG